MSPGNVAAGDVEQLTDYRRGVEARGLRGGEVRPGGDIMNSELSDVKRRFMRLPREEPTHAATSGGASPGPSVVKIP